MQLTVIHDSHYRYEIPVSLSPHLLYLRPRQNSSQRVSDFAITVSSGAILSNVIDPLDNDLVQAFFPADTDRIDVRTAFQVETLNPNPFNFVLQGNAMQYPFDYDRAFATALTPYRLPPFDDTQAQIKYWLDENFAAPPAETVEFLSELIQVLFQTIEYHHRDELGIQTSIETIQGNRGTCRDFAVLFVEICRYLGFAARFVSGYLFTPSDKADLAANSMHAWTEVYLPGAGWKGLDPTHGVWCDDCYIAVAHGAQAQSVNPVQGNYFSKKSVASQLDATVTVTQVSA